MTKEAKNVNEADVDAEVKRMQDRNGRLLTREGAAENGDTVDIDFEGFVDGKAFEGGKAEHYFTISENAAAAPTITTDTLPGGKVGEAYSQTLIATGTTPITWGIDSGNLPAGLTLDEATGEISGTPTAEGTAKFTVKAENSAGSDTKELSITITKDAPPAHEHSYGDWSKDGTSHWHECTDTDCPNREESITDKAAHVYTRSEERRVYKELINTITYNATLDVDDDLIDMLADNLDPEGTVDPVNTLDLYREVRSSLPVSFEVAADFSETNVAIAPFLVEPDEENDIAPVRLYKDDIRSLFSFFELNGDFMPQKYYPRIGFSDSQSIRMMLHLKKRGGLNLNL